MSENNSERIVNINSENQSNLPNHQNRLPNDIRIEIHQTVPNFNLELNNQRVTNSFGEMPRNISTFINQARDEIGRQSERTRMWRMHFNNVFLGVRPLVQQAQNTNTFRTWIPNASNFRTISVTDRNHLPVRNLQSALNESVAINLNPPDSIQYDRHSRTIHSNNNTPVSNVNSASGSGIGSVPSTISNRPILDRVAALTRDDPPDLLERHTIHRHNQRDGDGNDEDDALTGVFAQLPLCIPLLCILFIKFAYDNFESITGISTLSFIFIRANATVRDQISKQTQRSIWILLREIVYMALVVYFVFFIVENDMVNVRLIPITKVTDTITVSRVLFSTFITDLILQLITVAIKIAITTLPPKIIQYKGRGRIYLLVEAISQFYRSIIPIQMWFMFFLDPYTGPEKIVGVIFSSVYMTTKTFDLVKRVKFCRNSFKMFFRTVNYGSLPTKEQMQTAGKLCPICYDAFVTPVVLECEHIFCEQCVGTWFSKQQTCPLCRAKVAADPTWQDGETCFYPQLC